MRTARLTLRAPTPADAPAIFATYASDPVATRYMGWPRHEKLASTEWFVSFAMNEWTTHGTGTHLIFLGDTDTLIGSTGVHVDENTRDEVATGYILGQPYWGHGYATEACQAMVALARSRGDRRITAYCHAAHTPSAHVLEKSGLAFIELRPKHIVFPNLGIGLEDVRYYALDL
jgi:RimJ/RimL family protein N-acetyltransferase